MYIAEPLYVIIQKYHDVVATCLIHRTCFELYFLCYCIQAFYRKQIYNVLVYTVLYGIYSRLNDIDKRGMILAVPLVQFLDTRKIQLTEFAIYCYRR